MTPLRKTLVAVTMAITLLPALPASASDYDYMGCNQLWYQRNSIYSQAGYCFKTARARAVFGYGCFAPYGRLSGYAQKTVSLIVTAERRKGCGGGY